MVALEASPEPVDAAPQYCLTAAMMLFFNVLPHELTVLEGHALALHATVWADPDLARFTFEAPSTIYDRPFQ